MTEPRLILPGTTYLVTRRSIKGHFLFIPNEEITNLFFYLLGVGQERYGIEFHAITVMTNHYHFVLTDPEANLPAFEGWLNSQLARSLQVYHDWEEYIWGPGSYNAPILLREDTVLDKITYVLANPVQAGLVERGHLWPGVRITFQSPETTYEFTRPTFYFRKNGNLPEKSTLRLSKPPPSKTPPTTSTPKRCTTQPKRESKRSEPNSAAPTANS